MTPEEFELLSQLTIVIPTYNRPLELERSIEYWRDTPVTVHFIDGSPRPHFVEGLLSNTVSIYYHFMPALPPVNPQLNAYRRLVFATSLPQTKYSAVGCDDDFYTISGLLESIKYLDHHIYFDAAVGSEFHYRQKGNNLVWNFHRGPKKKSIDLESSSIDEKILVRSSWYLYAVCRTPLWRKYLEIVYTERGFSHSQYLGHEWLMHYLSKAMFKTKRLDLISLVRQHLIPGRNLDPEVSWSEWLIDPKNYLLVNEVVEQLANGFNVVTSPADSAKNLALARGLILKEQAQAHIDERSHNDFSVMVRTIFSSLLFMILPNLKVFSDRPHKLKDSWEMLGAIGLSYDRREIQDINDLLMKPRDELRLRTNI